MKEQPQRRRRRALSLCVGAEHVEDRHGAARLQAFAHPPQERGDLLAGEVVDDVEHQRPVVGAAEVGFEHVAVAVLDASPLGLIFIGEAAYRRPDARAASSASLSWRSTRSSPASQKPGSARSMPTNSTSSSGLRDPPAASISR